MSLIRSGSVALIEPILTIGVPVYNAQHCIIECLENIDFQMMAGAVVVVADNASDDNTGMLCEEFCSGRENFRYVRHKKNIGAHANFTYLINSCETKYFSFRAHDDLSSGNYFSELTSILSKYTDASLAVSDVSWTDVPKKKWKNYHVNPGSNPTKPRRIISGYREFSPLWFYGVYDASVAKMRWNDFFDAHEHKYHCDVLFLMLFLARGEIVFSDKARFIGRRLDGKEFNFESVSIKEFIESFRVFIEVSRQGISQNKLKFIEKIIVYWNLIICCDHRVVSVRRVVRSIFLSPFRKKSRDLLP